jgi:hypothetical protein
MGCRVDPWIDPNTVPVRSAVLAPLVDWIRKNWLDGRPVRLLDYGCGDLLLARLLPSGCTVDGFDSSPAAREAARSASAGNRSAGHVHDDPGEIPEGAYDGVVLSSVLQYLSDAGAVGELIGDVSRWLRDDGALGAVATDVVVPGSSRLPDLLDLSVHLLRSHGPLRAASVLTRSARRSPRRLLSLDHAELLEMSLAAGLETQQLEENLSPLGSRSSYAFQVR